MGVFINSSQKRNFAILAAVFGSLLLLFQNCSSPTGTTISETSDFSSTAKEAKIEGTPFAFDTNLNLISHMSCTYSSLSSASRSGLMDSDAFYSYRGSAENQFVGSDGVTYFDEHAGVKLNSDFLAYAKEKFYHLDGTEDSDLVKKALIESPNNENAQAQMAIRSRLNFESGLLKMGSKPELGTEYNNLSVEFPNPYIVNSLHSASTAATPYRINYFSGGTGVDFRKLIGSVYFQQDESIGQQVRDALTNSSLLTLTYTDTSDIAKAGGEFIARPNSAGKTIGLGYKFTFSLPKSSSDEGTPPVCGTDLAACDFGGSRSLAAVISTIREVNLPTGQIKSDVTWTCPSRMRFKIIPLSKAATLCPQDNNLYQNGELVPEAVLAFKHLPAGKWRINATLQCAVPLTGECYPDPEIVNWDGSEACGPTESWDCAHYVSFCLKN